MIPENLTIDVPSGKTSKLSVSFNPGLRTTCRNCGAEIVWANSKAWKTFPVQEKEGAWSLHLCKSNHPKK